MKKNGAALHVAAWDPKIEILQLLLERGARTDINNVEGRTVGEGKETKDGAIFLGQARWNTLQNDGVWKNCL